MGWGILTCDWLDSDLSILVGIGIMTSCAKVQETCSRSECDGFFSLPPQWKQFKIWKTEYSLYMYKIAYIFLKKLFNGIESF